MPFAAKYKSNDPNAPVQSGQAQNISGSSAGFNVPGANAGIQGKTTKGSGQYQNLEKYVSANQPQGQQMGEKIASDVGSSISGAQKQVGDVVGKVQKTTAYDPNAAISSSTNLTPEQQAMYKATKSTGGYTGPKDVTGLEGYGEAYTASERAQAQKKALGSNVGQQGLLAESYKAPTYTAGQSKLDQNLIQGSVGGQKALSDLSEKYKDLSSQFEGQFGQAGKDITASQEQAKANIDAFAPAEAKAREELMNPLQATAEKYNRINADLADLSGTGMDQETLDYLGITPGQRTMGVDISQFVNPQGNQTVNTVATPEQRKRYAELESLFGTQGNVLTPESQTPAFNPFNIAGFKEKVGGAPPVTSVTSPSGTVMPIKASGAEGFAYQLASIYPSFGEGKGSMSEWMSSGMSPEEYAKGDQSILDKIRGFASSTGLSAGTLG